jgi:hypothetical protein
VAFLLLHRHATVTICHSRTADLPAETRRADILVAAVVRPRLITGTMLKPGAVVIDVGINRVEGKLVGDVDFESAVQVASAITPVPGGVGPMTWRCSCAIRSKRLSNHPTRDPRLPARHALIRAGDGVRGSWSPSTAVGSCRDSL